MIEMWIADLRSNEVTFSVPGAVGRWDFHRRDDYESLLDLENKGQCALTYYSSNETVTAQTSDADFILATDELIDACLLLSFFTASCVTPSSSTPQSDCMFVNMGDAFIRPRAIRGFEQLQLTSSYHQFFSNGMSAIRSTMAPRQLRLFLSHWISGLTCFSLEDLFLAIGVQMDIVKQCEIARTGFSKNYFQGMESASTHYGIPMLGSDYKNMRNDIVHSGKLSDRNFPNKGKNDCAMVIAETLNWIDKYVCAVLGISSLSLRWSGPSLASGLPSLTVQ